MNFTVEKKQGGWTATVKDGIVTKGTVHLIGSDYRKEGQGNDFVVFSKWDNNSSDKNASVYVCVGVDLASNPPKKISLNAGKVPFSRPHKNRFLRLEGNDLVFRKEFGHLGGKTGFWEEKFDKNFDYVGEGVQCPDEQEDTSAQNAGTSEEGQQETELGAVAIPGTFGVWNTGEPVVKKPKAWFIALVASALGLHWWYAGYWWKTMVFFILMLGGGLFFSGIESLIAATLGSLWLVGSILWIILGKFKTSARKPLTGVTFDRYKELSKEERHRILNNKTKKIDETEYWSHCIWCYVTDTDLTKGEKTAIKVCGIIVGFPLIAFYLWTAISGIIKFASGN